jgi:hypothetical protein
MAEPQAKLNPIDVVALPAVGLASSAERISARIAAKMSSDTARGLYDPGRMAGKAIRRPLSSLCAVRCASDARRGDVPEAPRGLSSPFGLS